MRYLFLLLPLLLFAKPKAVICTWQNDPQTTMTIVWQTKPTKIPSYIHYKRADASTWQTQLAVTKSPFDAVSVHTVPLENLDPGTNYYFRLDNDPELHAFRTISPSEEITFVVGGDAYHRSIKRFRQMNNTVASLSPDFVILGGDIAYELSTVSLFRSKNWEVRRYETFFKEYSQTLIDSDGRHIPLLLVAGNHDVKGPPTDPVTAKSLLYDFYPFGHRTYQTLDFNDQFSLFLLDSGHGYSIRGEQTDWLKNKLHTRHSIPHKIAVYHRAAYPSHYRFEGGAATKLRTHWTPLFDEYGLKVAFENDNHTYKRTLPLKGEQPDKNGVLYLGDGAYAVKPRTPKTPLERWYLARSGALNNVFLVKITPTTTNIQAIDIQGATIESLIIY